MERIIVQVVDRRTGRVSLGVETCSCVLSANGNFMPVIETADNPVRRLTIEESLMLIKVRYAKTLEYLS